MTLIKYKHINFQRKSLALIQKANEIIAEYTELGYVLTLRQLYYQFVARALIKNSHRSYKNLGELINNARLTGMMSWEAIIDRTRNLRGQNTFQNPQDMINGMINSYAIDLWKNIQVHLEVWVEKDALIDVVAKACNKYQVDFFSTRGYCSQTEVWNASQRFNQYTDADYKVQIIHLSDHDPSGINMTEDLNNRMRAVFQTPVRIKRLALTMDQVECYEPPPNPVKQTDSRCPDYQEKYGDESWELDALPPQIIEGLIHDEIEKLTGKKNLAELEKQRKKMERERKEIKAISDNYSKALTAAKKKAPKKKAAKKKTTKKKATKKNVKRKSTKKINKTNKRVSKARKKSTARKASKKKG